MNQSVIIFDFDGTLADSLPIIVRTLNQSSSRFGFKRITSARMQQFRNQSLLSMIKDLEISLFKIPFLLGRLQQQLALHYKEIHLYSGIGKILKDLNKRGYRLGIVSRNHQQIITAILQQHHLEDEFIFVSNAHLWQGKQTVLTQLLQKYHLKNKQTLYVGDEARDIVACKKAAIPILVLPGAFIVESISHHFSLITW